MKSLAAIGFLIAAIAQPASANPQHHVAARGCAALKSRIDAVPAGPGFLRSYDSADGGEPDSPPLRTAAFVYDNSLAVIALIACGDVPRASRIGEALRLAAENDSRLRSAYRAGAAENSSMPTSSRNFT